jgi:nitroreductase
LTNGSESEITPFDPETFSVPPENLLNFIKFRRSIRSFKETPVEREKIEKILQAAAWSPTGGNRRLFRYVVIDGNEKIRNFAARGLKALDRYAASIPPEKVVTLPNPKYLEIWKTMYRLFETNGTDRLLFDAPLVITLVGSTPDKLDAGIASSNMELMASALGLGACYIGFFGLAAEVDPDLKKSLGITPKETILTTLIFGYTDRKYLRTVNRGDFQKTNWI